MDWSMLANVVVSALVAGLLSGTTSWQANPAGTWKSHVAVGCVAAITALANHFRQSPLPEPPPSPMKGTAP